MAMSLQVMYPIADDTTFDYDYYFATHMKLVAQYMGTNLQSTFVTKGLAGGPKTPPGFYAIATMVFGDQAAMDAAMAASGPVLADIPNFTNCQPQMLVGQVVA